ncbi:DUF6438 domain-containing protein [Belliella sp. DSM 107340]|uniref:DUF6438 domain-containing protein n=1 Tax=Belliella calami TaxID=2923436 RepID=A0ABS9UQG3_9BACT|nr:DUF6438 domain-containing protein [Belliella calami]MCH7398855.1 DUF6438 domain-containing protein [Belliella calami]
MKNLYLLFFSIIFFSCNNGKEEAIKVNLNGIWYGEQTILIQDSVMTNPFWDSYGFFYYSIRNDTLIVEDPELESVGKIEFIDKNHIKIIDFQRDNYILEFERITISNPRKFDYLNFESGDVEGRLPFFNMHIDRNGLVTYEGELYSDLKGKQNFQLDTLILNQLNQLFEMVDIWNYPEEEFLPVAGSGEMNLTIRYPEGEIIKIDNGLFEGKYFILQKVFNRFESLLIKKKAYNITLDTAGGSE